MEVDVSFNEKYIARLAGLKWTEKDGFAGWTGTKAAIKRFEEYKKSLPILQNTSVQTTAPKRLEDDISEEDHDLTISEEDEISDINIFL